MVNTSKNKSHTFVIAFSVHGTNSYRVFERNTRYRQKEDESLETFVQRVLGKDFTPKQSRRMDYYRSTDGIKVHWKGLMTQENAPMTNKSWLSRRFNELRARGWEEVPAITIRPMIAA